MKCENCLCNKCKFCMPQGDHTDCHNCDICINGDMKRPDGECEEYSKE